MAPKLPEPGCDQVPDGGSRYRRCRLFQPVKRRAAVTVASVWVCSVVEEYPDGPQEGRPGRVVQRRRVDGAAVVRAGPVAQQGADVLRIVLATLVPGAAGPDPRA